MGMPHPCKKQQAAVCLEQIKKYEVITMIFENVLEVFQKYLSEDSSCEILNTSRGYLVVDWESNKNNWITSRLCQTPEQLLDTLRSRWEEYQGYQLTDGYKKDMSEQEEQEIKRQGAALAAKCESGF